VIAIRHLLRYHRRLALWVIVLALALKVVVPGGYMVGTEGGSITVQLCSGYGPQTMVVAMPGMAHHSEKKGDHGKSEMPCAFSGLSGPSLAAVDPLLLLAAIAFILLTVFRLADRPAVRRALPYLRPPLRGPPAQA
jgi:hypothetical protein